MSAKTNKSNSWVKDFIYNVRHGGLGGLHFLSFYIALALYILGTFVIASAEMGLNAGSTDVIASTFISQSIILVACIIAYFIFSNLPNNPKYSSYKVMIGIFSFITVLLLITRFFGLTNGAYGWIKLPGGFTIQPSEFAKVFTVYAGGVLLTSSKNKNILKKYSLTYLFFVIFYFLLVLLYQKDFGSAFVIALIGFFEFFIMRKQYGKKVIIFLYCCLILGVLAVIFIYSPLADPIFDALTNISYKFARFSAFINPFAYEYDNGYELIMSFASYATGGWLGLGYTKSIHKYMNFPNIDTDFILPIFVEEFGYVGFIVLVLVYIALFADLIYQGLLIKNKKGKLILISTFIYIGLHFVLNIGGVTGFIPLTGVPLLLISKGGSSAMSFFACLGLCYREIRKQKKIKDENNSGQI